MLKKIVVFSHIRSQARAGQCRHQNYFFRLMSGAAFLVFIPLALLSCSLMNTDLKEYLCEYTEDAAVMTYEFATTYPSDSSGTVCLPSGAARTVTLKLRNPQHYTIDCGYSFPSAASSAAAALSAGGVAPVTYAQGTDTTLITATFSDELLTAMEKGGDVSLTVSLTEHVSQRSFTSYTVPVHANTPPPEADGAMVCIDTNASPNTYVLCFNMPSTAKMSSSGIHGDITSLTINDTSYPLTIDSATGTFSFTGSPAALSQTAPAGLAANSTSGNGYTFTPRNQPVYFSTGDIISSDNKSYKITLTDAAGLATSVTTSVQAVKLGNVYMKDADGNVIAAGASIPQDSGSSYSTVTIFPPDTTADASGTVQNTSDAKVLYQIYRGTDSTGTLLMDGESSGGSVTLKLPAGEIYINAYARKTLWADSLELAHGYKVLATRVYVNPSFTGTCTGSKDYPFTTVAAAVNALSAKTESANTVTLLADTAENISTASYGESTVFTLDGGSHTLAPSSGYAFTSSSSHGSVTLKNLTVASGGISVSEGTLTLTDITVNAGGIAKTGGTLVLTGGTVITVPGTKSDTSNDISLASGQTFQISALTADSVAKISPLAYTYGIVMVKGTSSYTLTADDCNRFSVTPDGSTNYLVDIDTTGTTPVGVLAQAGIAITFAPGTFTLTPTITAWSASSEQTIGFTIANSSGTIISSGVTSSLLVTSATVGVYSNGAPVLTGTTVTNGCTGTVTVPSGVLQAGGSYRVNMTAIISGYTYSGAVTVAVN